MIFFKRQYIDDLAVSRQSGRQSKKFRMQGAQILKNEVYLPVR